MDGGGEGKVSPSRGREFYKTAIVVGGVSCRPVLDNNNNNSSASNDVLECECVRVCVCASHK